MAKNNDKLSLASRGLKHKLRIAACLMAVLPLLITGYLVSNYILPKVGLKVDVAASILVSILVALVGFILIKQIFDRILSVTNAAKLITSGDISHKFQIEEADEVSDLGDALNQLTRRIRGNMDELKNYGTKTSEINLQMQKRVIMFSSLLQISSLVSQGAKLEEILKLTVEKSRLLANSEMAYLLFREEGQETFRMKAADGMHSDELLEINILPKEELFNRIISSNEPLVIDKQNVLPENLMARFREKFKLSNTLALPVYLRGRVVAIMGIGNSKASFLYKKDDMELLDIFTKQIAIAIENDILTRRLEKLEIKDALTGLYNEVFIHDRLQEEIKRAIIYRRPCAFILIDIDNFKTYHQNYGLLHTEAALKKIATLIRDSVSDVDKVGRTGDDEFAIIVPERNKRQAQQIAEHIRERIEFTFSEEPNADKKITASGGVSENPLDGVDARELAAKAKELLGEAKKQGKNRIVGFKETPVCQ